MIPSSFKIYTSFGKLEPATRNNLDRLGFGYQRACDPRVQINQRYELDPHKDHQKGKADPNPSRLGKVVLHEFKHKAKTQSNTG
jgi:hypothetical protein